MKVHKHAKMMEAKVNNMYLVLFTKVSDGWRKYHRKNLPCEQLSEYYLCHPKHAKECEAWLNGVNVLANDVAISNNVDVFGWHPNSLFMDPDFNIKIAPKKEKRWIIVHPDELTSYSCKTKEFADAVALTLDGCQIFEVEV